MNNLLIKVLECTEDYENHYKLATMMNLDVNRNMHPIIIRAYIISNIDKIIKIDNDEINYSENINLDFTINN